MAVKTIENGNKLSISRPVSINTNNTHNNNYTGNSDLDKLAQSVAIAETSNCTAGYALTHNNCHGIKNGNTYPCKTKKGSKMCNFETKEESFKAFKIIWGKWYQNPPTMADANKWTGRDRAKTWLKNVKSNLK